MRTVRILFLCHLAALVFGLGGLLIALPHPELWDTNPNAAVVFNFGIHYAGSLHILFGAATVLLFGLLFVGTRKTLIFFVAATTISLSMELLGTSTGFPFGAYSYSSFLGFKIAGHVPFSIPLSWFYMGFTSFMLANLIVDRLGWRYRTACSLALGAYFLTVWDLALDPAMASQSLPIHFWYWQQAGPYFGMPVRNLVGWSITGLAFMGVSRLIWSENLDPQRLPAWLPYGIYAANIGFAIALNIGVGLWLPPLLAIALGIFPISLVLLATRTGHAPVRKDSLSRRITHLVMRKVAWMLARRHVELIVEGLEYVPPSGPTLIVARHFHHLYDGCVLLKATPRQVHILVALDWIKQPWLRSLMEQACTLADWPRILRTERLKDHDDKQRQEVHTLAEARGLLRHAVQDSLRLLRHGNILVIFPEGYPTIDPVFTPKETFDAFLPFRPGFARLAEMVEKDGRTRVAIIPAGFTYMQRDRWRITLRFGPPLFRNDFHTIGELVQVVERQVHELSDSRSIAAFTHAEETIQL